MPASNWRADYESNLAAGMGKEKALLSAFSSSTYDDFLHEAENGPYFDNDAARIAAVHTRLDVALLNYQAGVQVKLLQAILGWVKIACAAVVAAAIAVLLGS